jgi:ketosteroid isomerase-like protein
VGWRVVAPRVSFAKAGGIQRVRSKLKTQRRERVVDTRRFPYAAFSLREGAVTPIETVLLYMDRINQHDAEKLVELNTDDAEFVDSLGGKMSGRPNMIKGWKGYFAFVPDYWVSHEEVLGDGKLVAVFGAAGGTIAGATATPDGGKWRTNAAWLAVVEGGLVKKWQVYADNKPVYDILAAMKGK